MGSRFNRGRNRTPSGTTFRHEKRQRLKSRAHNETFRAKYSGGASARPHHRSIHPRTPYKTRQGGSAQERSEKRTTTSAHRDDTKQRNKRRDNDHHTVRLNRAQKQRNTNTSSTESNRNHTIHARRERSVMPHDHRGKEVQARIDLRPIRIE